MRVRRAAAFTLSRFGIVALALFTGCKIVGADLDKGKDRSMTIDPQKFTNCQDAPASLISVIESTLKVEGGGSLGSAKMLKGIQNSEVVYLGANIVGNAAKSPSKLGMAIGIWATGALSGKEPIYAITPPALNYSPFPPGANKNQSEALFRDEAVNYLSNCVVTAINQA